LEWHFKFKLDKKVKKYNRQNISNVMIPEKWCGNVFNQILETEILKLPNWKLNSQDNYTSQTIFTEWEIGFQWIMNNLNCLSYEREMKNWLIIAL